MKKSALILSGGSVKGCFQAGAIQYVVESGFLPDSIYGTSVGSLNGSFLTNAAGKLMQSKNSKDKLNQQEWNSIAQQLVDYWKNNIQKPADVVTQRGKISDIIHIITNKFKGLSDTTPVYNKIDKLLDVTAMQYAAPALELRVATVDFICSQMIYASPFDTGDKDFISCLKGSMAIPVAMPPFVLDKGNKHQVLFDGGVRAVAPLGQAINDNAVNIVGILCQADELEVYSDFHEQKLISLVERTQDIIVNQNVKNDTHFANIISQIKQEAINKGITNLDSLNKYALVESLIIQPSKEIKISIEDFNTADISKGIQDGYDTAKKIMTANPVQWII